MSFLELDVSSSLEASMDFKRFSWTRPTRLGLRYWLCQSLLHALGLHDTTWRTYFAAERNAAWLGLLHFQLGMLERFAIFDMFGLPFRPSN